MISALSLVEVVLVECDTLSYLEIDYYPSTFYGQGSVTTLPETKDTPNNPIGFIWITDQRDLQ